MIARLRRRHRVMWLLLAVALVVAYLAALMARPQEPIMEGLPSALAPAAAEGSSLGAVAPPDEGDERSASDRESERSGR